MQQVLLGCYLLDFAPAFQESGREVLQYGPGSKFCAVLAQSFCF